MFPPKSEERINVTREAAKKAKLAFEEAVAQRANSQREVNDLLSRKSTWGDSDVGRFTTLVRQDHIYEQEEARAKAVVDEVETAVEREFSQLLRAILARYHEEQVWSDKNPERVDLWIARSPWPEHARFHHGNHSW